MHRRSFLQHLVWLGGAAPLVPLGLGAADDAAGRQFRLCLNPGAIGVRANQLEAMALAARYGFEAVEPMPGALADLDAAAMAGMLEKLRAAGLVWGAAGLPVNFRGEEGAFRADLEALPRLASALQRAGVTRVGTWLSPSHGQLTYWANFQLHRQRLNRVAGVLGDHGLRLGLEYVGTHTSLVGQKYPFVHTLAETLDLIGALEARNVGVVLDTWHWWQAGDTVESLRSLSAETVVAVDLNDAPVGREKREQRDGERELPAATGLIEVRPFLQALVAIGYDGPVRAEPFNRVLNELENDAACSATAEAMRKAIAGI